MNLPRYPESGGYFTSTYSPEAKVGLAPVHIWWESPLGQRDYWRAKKSARLLLVRGEAFVDDVYLPKENVTGYLDARVERGEIEYVIVFPARDTKWGEIFPVLDECRKSRVRVVLLNQFES